MTRAEYSTLEEYSPRDFSSDSQAEVPVSNMGKFAPHREMRKIRRSVQPEIDARM
ncbi:hypothetical protein T12_15966 [Trichinella patagoniensis]|uniref:Uncharacterized protein n=1 Tax=Trichinella patagoniensis TaxID=990121 RepID=A0A0V0X964_9BILA|nr:hypothetical protein T12_15966 [Trichinella patagoniensis]